ncbi:efflux RND transporter periplasmic adaptor subunit [Hymenobacter sp. H14-R3]|uniref:efflux RND transporter periplasmic adaptor subunit n=1 Tax=Hymenobacter sp. H14-R3 TaxID=3046308 RepID=UPI0024BA9751|nr:efflux RND transporter periplasmic adaptor subunit [Hymenobacter sp. H14-R3]MDJ0367758.1 efflux RND transporter periplasmic adaptor subunit [Hymenobacter sp. H14-R3]
MPFFSAALRHTTPLVVAGALALLAGCHAKPDEAKGGKGGKKDTGPALVDVLVARPSTITDSVEANGTIVANDFVELHPEVNGRLTFLQVNEGKRVTKGSIIARINDADLQAQLQKTRALLQVSRLSQTRLQTLLKVQGVNQADYDLAVSQVRSNEADAAYSQAMIAKTIVRAPFTGVLGLRQVSAGAYVTPATIIATLQADTKLKVDFTLPEASGSVVHPGSVVLVYLAGNPPRRYPATVLAQESQVNQTTRNLTVRALLPPGAQVSPGSFARVRVPAGAARRSVLLPTNALLPGDKSDQVVLVKNGKAVLQNVRTGDRQNDHIAIISGLAAGDSVVTNGVLFTQPGKPVKVRKAQAKN